MHKVFRTNPSRVTAMLRFALIFMWLYDRKDRAVHEDWVAMLETKMLYILYLSSYSYDLYEL